MLQGCSLPPQRLGARQKYSAANQSSQISDEMVASNIELQVARQIAGLLRDACQKRSIESAARELGREDLARQDPVGQTPRHGVGMPSVPAREWIVGYPVGRQLLEGSCGAGSLVWTLSPVCDEFKDEIEVVEMEPPELTHAQVVPPNGPVAQCLRSTDKGKRSFDNFRAYYNGRLVFVRPRTRVSGEAPSRQQIGSGGDQLQCWPGTRFPQRRLPADNSRCPIRHLPRRNMPKGVEVKLNDVHP